MEDLFDPLMIPPERPSAYVTPSAFAWSKQPTYFYLCSKKQGKQRRNAQGNNGANFRELENLLNLGLDFGDFSAPAVCWSKGTCHKSDGFDKNLPTTAEEELFNFRMMDRPSGLK